MLRDENIQLSTLAKAAQVETGMIETQLVDAKLRAANLDLENDQLACKLQHKGDQIKVFSERVTALEIELLRSKQELGEALNEIYDFEQTQADRQIKERVVKSHDSSGENNDESHQKKQDEDQTDGGSGSTIKKISKKDQFKNFFKKHTSNPKQ